MPDLTTREAIQLMLGPPIQIANARIGRAQRNDRPELKTLWTDASTKLQQALAASMLAAAADEPLQ